MRLTDDGVVRGVQSQKDKPLYDYKYALRLCHQEGKLRACVAIYTSINMFEVRRLLLLCLRADCTFPVR